MSPFSIFLVLTALYSPTISHKFTPEELLLKSFPYRTSPDGDLDPCKTGNQSSTSPINQFRSGVAALLGMEVHRQVEVLRLVNDVNERE
ncbi:unnamed protein product [Nezara viridula]|uniref:Neuropeptide n=1 Tax=Nezara viridula TaxID=85310 RepID=A0A9P0HMA1_NEZVI|nr:unnamed protein product [Nezara viridula]